MRQERIVKKEGEKDVCGESERGSPVIQTLQTIRPKYEPL